MVGQTSVYDVSGQPLVAVGKMATVNELPHRRPGQRRERFISLFE